jgi:peptidoglycan/xylan/chitin deacetylase (PgdA/CDA1 family)
LLLIVVLVGLLAGTFLTGEVSFAHPQASGQAQQSAVPQAAATSTTWYFAEGSVGGTFQEFLTLFNPNSSAASVTISYLFQGSRASMSVTRTVNANSRSTENVNNDVGIKPGDPQQSLSAIVKSSVPIVAERPMYFTVHGISSGTDVLGATNTNSSTYYFADGDASAGYYTWISILNPSPTDTAHIIIRYFAGGSRVGLQVFDVGPLKRGTGSPNAVGLHQPVAVMVESTIGVVVERPTYFSANIPGAGGATTGAASLVGATNPGSDWLFAEGYTGPIFQEYLALANFTYNDDTAHIKLMYQNGSTQTINLTVKALSLSFFDVNYAYTHPQPGGTPTPEVSAEVTSDAPSLVVERQMYFHSDSQSISGGTDVIGEVGPASHSLYTFAEGFVRADFQEFLTVQNLTNNAETAAITLFVNKTPKLSNMALKPHSRNTLDINRFLALPPGLPSSNYEVSMSVQTTSGVIVAERPMYFKTGTGQGGTDIIGFTGDPASGVDACASNVPPVSSTEIDIGNTSTKQVALTFDAGGDVAPASAILSILNNRGVHATWFFTGVWAQQSPVLVRQVANSGYEIGNHTMTHPDLANIATVEECKQLKTADATVSRITVRSTMRPYFRPPYGSRDTLIRQTAANLGYRTVMWTIDTLDWQTDSTPARILQIIKDNLKPGAIILMHAGSVSESQALDTVITYLQSQGYSLKTITEIIQ